MARSMHQARLKAVITTENIFSAAIFKPFSVLIRLSAWLLQPQPGV
jgi:hypothetical protein